MTSRSTAVLAVLVVALALAVPIGAGALSPQDGVSPQMQQEDNQTEPPDDNQTATPDDAEAADASFTVNSISAPDSTAPGSTVTVVAFVENPNDEAQAQPVELRLGGDVADRERVTIEANSVQAVTFEASTEGLETGEYLHGVFTEGDGLNARLTISESFTVSDLSAPATATAGDTVTASATVTNPNDFETTQRVTFRFGGAPLVTEEMTLDAGESTEFTAEANTTGVGPGEYVHGVLTRDAGQVALITIEEQPESTVSFSAQESDGTTVTVDSATLPDGGYVVIHDNTLLGDENTTADPVGSVVGTSEYLEAGTSENITVELFDVPGAEFNQTELTEDQTLIAMTHRETMGDRTLDFVRSGGEQDGPYTVNGTAVTAPAEITVNVTEPAAPEATVTAGDQETNGTTVTVDSVTASEGGFVAIHDSSLLEGNVVGSVIGVSEFVEQGTTENVTIELFDVDGAELNQTELTENQTLIAMPHLDTNENAVYDFVISDGADDGPYTTDGEVVIDTFNVTVADAEPPADNESETPEDNTTEPPEDNETAPGDNETTGDNATDGTTDGEEPSDDETQDSDETQDGDGTQDEESTSESESTPTPTPSD